MDEGESQQGETMPATTPTKASAASVRIPLRRVTSDADRELARALAESSTESEDLEAGWGHRGVGGV